MAIHIFFKLYCYPAIGRPRAGGEQSDNYSGGLVRYIATGIVAGSIAAVVASLVSLPLRSPDDALLNSATVTLAALATGVAAGLLWRVVSPKRNGLHIFTGLWAGAFGVVAVISVAGETQLNNFIGFALPLAAIVFPVTGVLTILLPRSPLAGRWQTAAVAAVIALAVGIPLAGQGDQESGRLELPPRTHHPDSGNSPDYPAIMITSASRYPQYS